MSNFSVSQVVEDLLTLTSRAEANHFWFRGFRKFVSPVLQEVVNGRTTLRLVDCGCGTGNNIRLLQPHGRAIGFDVAETGVSTARASGLTVMRGDVTRIPLASDTVDVATAFDVLQCVEADASAIREMARIVKPGGVVVLTLAALEGLRGDHSEAWGEVRRYSPVMARRLVTTAGLRVERVSYVFASLVPLMATVRFVQRATRPFRNAPRADADIAVPAAPVNLVLTALVSAEAALAKYVRMPIGSSLLVVARKGQSAA